MASVPETRLQLEIDTLTLHGYNAADAATLRQSLAEELQRLIREAGPGWSPGNVRASSTETALNVPVTTRALSPRAAASAIAAAIWPQLGAHAVPTEGAPADRHEGGTPR